MKKEKSVTKNTPRRNSINSVVSTGKDTKLEPPSNASNVYKIKSIAKSSTTKSEDVSSDSSRSKNVKSNSVNKLNSDMNPTLLARQKQRRISWTGTHNPQKKVIPGSTKVVEKTNISNISQKSVAKTNNNSSKVKMKKSKSFGDQEQPTTKKDSVEWKRKKNNLKTVD